MDPITESIVALLKAGGDSERAVPMSAYMKNRFPFLGIMTPRRKQLLNPVMKQSKTLELERLKAIIFELYGLEEREFHYAAIDLLAANINRLPGRWPPIADYLPLIQEKSWWDSVDALRKPISLWAKKAGDPLIAQIMDYLLASENKWDRRVAITLQLQWKESTRLVWLEKAIIANLSDDEFFIQKGIGWALREYAKTDTAWVSRFLEAHGSGMSVLAVREASKHLHKQ